MSLAMFTLEGDQLVPAEIARSMWKHDQMHGVAISGALARAVEMRLAELGRDDLHPARYTVDLFQPAKMAPCTVTTEVVREGRRICLIDAVLLAGRRARSPVPAHLPAADRDAEGRRVDPARSPRAAARGPRPAERRAPRAALRQ